MHRNGGFSFLGFVFFAIFVALVALIGFKVTPVYVEYFSVKKMLSALAMEAKETPPAEVRRAFERKLSAEYVDEVSPADLEIGKDGGQIVLTVSYIRKVRLVSNVSLLFEFEATARH